VVDVSDAISPDLDPRELWERLRPARRHLVVAFVGGHKTGKSTWINYVAGREVAATDVLPCTDRVGSYLFSLDPTTRAWSFVSGPTAFAEHPCQSAGRPGVPVELVDTPGIGALEEAHEWDTSLLDRCHVIVMVHTAVQGIRADERDLLDGLLRRGPSHVHLMFTRTDGLGDADQVLEALTATIRRGIQAYPRIKGISCSGRHGSSEQLFVVGSPVLERLREAALDELPEHLQRLDIFAFDRAAEGWAEALRAGREERVTEHERLQGECVRLQRSIELLEERLASLPEFLLSVARQATTAEIERAMRDIRIARGANQEQPIEAPANGLGNEGPSPAEATTGEKLIQHAGRALLEGGQRWLERSTSTGEAPQVPFETPWSSFSAEALGQAMFDRVAGHLQRHEAAIASRYGELAARPLVIDAESLISRTTAPWLEHLEALGCGTTLDLVSPREDLVSLLDRVERRTTHDVNTAAIVQPLVAPLAEALTSTRTQLDAAAEEIEVFGSRADEFASRVQALREALDCTEG
jgi:hypothetical protein